MKAAIALVVSLALPVSAMAQDRPPIEHIGKPMLGNQRLPFSDAVRVGDTVYLSGEIGRKPDGTLPAGIEAQARQTMDNIGAKLKAQGLGWGDVVKCTVMLDNMADWPAFNQVYVTHFTDGNFPARSAFGADGLALGALVELECIAYAGKK